MKARLVRWTAPGTPVSTDLFETVDPAAHQRAAAGAVHVLIAEIEPAELVAWRRDPSREPPVVVDVREPWEFEYCRIEDSRSLPLRIAAAGDRRAAARARHRRRLPSRRAQLPCGGVAEARRIRSRAQPSRRRRRLGRPGRARDEALLTLASRPAADQQLERTVPTTMRFRLLAFLLALALAAGGARAEDLVQIYREAQQNDPTLAAARANWTATQERVPQARAGLLPSVSAAGNVNANEGRSTTYGDPRAVSSNVFGEQQLLDLGRAAAVPRAERRRAEPGAAAGRAGRLHARRRRSRT